MYSQRIPISSLSSTEGYLTVSINFDYMPKYLPTADMNIVNEGVLSWAEQRVIKYINLPAKSIANMLHISIHTVKKHIRNIMAKTGCKSSLELALWAERNRILTDK